MALSDKLLQLAFGRSIPEMSSCIGIHLSANAAYISEARMSGGKPKVEQLIKVPLPPPPVEKGATRVSGVLNTELLGDTERLSGLIKPAMTAAGKWKSEFCVVTLDHTFGILRYFVMPAVEQKFQRMAVPAEAKKYIPVQFEDLVTDFQVEPLAPGPDRRPRQGALFGVTQGRSLESIRILIARLGLKLGGIELAPCSMARLWEAVEPSAGVPFVQVHFDGGDARVILSERGLPIFVREISMGAEAKVADRRKLDFTGCLDFSRKQLAAQRPTLVRLSGVNPEMAAWAEALAQESQLKVVPQDTAKIIGIKPTEWAGYASIGAAIRLLFNNQVAIDLSGAGRIDEADRRTALNILTAAGVVAGLLISVGLVRHGMAEVKSRELKRLNARGATVDAFKGKNKQQIEELVDQLRTKSNSISSVTNTPVRLTNVLEQIVENLPEQVWLNDMIYAYPMDQAAMGSSRDSARAFTMNGAVIGGSEAVEQDQAMRFKQSLERDERFQKAFRYIDVALSAGDTGAGSGSGGSGSTGRTRFTISCKGKSGG